ncbi:MAG TPA: hypothetical protein VJ878_01370 [Candidatus Izemoplasmatales bacterium]|nr:hypothetical protein [Candidatus Izemoplasmatales bacterium]
MKKLSIVKSLFVLVTMFVLVVTVTYAWIAYSESIDGGTISAGEIDYTYGGEFNDGSEIIYPSKNLLSTAITVNNQSSIDTQLRLIVTYTLIDDASTTQKIYKDDGNDDLKVVFDSTFVVDGDYWYYQALDHSIETMGVLSLISSIYYDGNDSSNEYASQNVDINLLIQVKQADNVSWSELATYDFETGNPT